MKFTHKIALSAAVVVTAAGLTFTATADHHEGDAAAPSGEEALKMLMEGNARFVAGEASVAMSPEKRSELAGGQSPYAIVVGCADSRVPPELAFDAQPGSLFVIRDAGNIVDDHERASIEYAVAVLETPLLVVLGHESCGAVGAAVKAEKDGEVFPGHIHDLVENIRPAVRDAMEHEDGDDLLDVAVRENVRRVVDDLERSQPIIGPAIRDGKLTVVPARYDLDTGEVTIIDMADKHHEGHDHSDHNHGHAHGDHDHDHD